MYFFKHSRNHIESFPLFETAVCKHRYLVIYWLLVGYILGISRQYRMDNTGFSAAVRLERISDIVARRDHFIDKWYHEDFFK